MRAPRLNTHTHKRTHRHMKHKIVQLVCKLSTDWMMRIPLFQVKTSMHSFLFVRLFLCLYVFGTGKLKAEVLAREVSAM